MLPPPLATQIAMKIANLREGDWSMLVAPDAKRGVALVTASSGALGLLVWDGSSLDDPGLKDRIQWGRAGQLLPVAEEAERALDLPEGSEDYKISAHLRAKYMESN